MWDSCSREASTHSARMSAPLPICRPRGTRSPGCAMLTLQLHGRPKGLSILLHRQRLSRIQGTESPPQMEGGKPSLRKWGMGLRSRGSSCFETDFEFHWAATEIPTCCTKKQWKTDWRRRIAFAFKVPLQYWDGAMLSGVIFLMIAHDGHFPANLSHLQTLCFLNCLCLNSK